MEPPPCELLLRARLVPDRTGPTGTGTGTGTGTQVIAHIPLAAHPRTPRPERRLSRIENPACTRDPKRLAQARPRGGVLRRA